MFFGCSQEKKGTAYNTAQVITAEATQSYNVVHLLCICWQLLHEHPSHIIFEGHFSYSPCCSILRVSNKPVLCANARHALCLVQPRQACLVCVLCSHSRHATMVCKKTHMPCLSCGNDRHALCVRVFHQQTCLVWHILSFCSQFGSSTELLRLRVPWVVSLVCSPWGSMASSTKN